LKSHHKVKAAENAVDTEEMLNNPHNACHQQAFRRSWLSPYCVDGCLQDEREDVDLIFVKYSLLNEAVALCNENENMEAFCLPIEHLTFDLTRDELCKMASLHNIHFRSDDRKPALQALFINHYCNICEHYVALFQKKHPFLTSTVEDEPFEMFPPKPLSHLQVEQIVNDFCMDTSPATFEELGCAVCGQLMINTELTV
jgi:hypothetical protein